MMGMVVNAIPAVQRVPVESLTCAPWNPREVRSERFSQLCRSLEADPDFLEQRPILANAEGIVYAGNHRLLAARQLGWATVPAILADVPDVLAKRRGLLDNNSNADWVDLDLAALLSELEMDGTDLTLLGFDDGELERLMAEADGRVVDQDSAAAEWRGMPEFEHEDKTAYRSLAVHFKDQDAVDAFAAITGQTITPETRYLWYPEIEIERYADKRYAPES